MESNCIKILFLRGQMFTPLVPVLKIWFVKQCKNKNKKNSEVVFTWIIVCAIVGWDELWVSDYASSHYLNLAPLSTLADNPRDSIFWTVSPGLQIRVWNLPENRNLPFLVDSTFRHKILNIYLALFQLYRQHGTFLHKLPYAIVI